MASTISAGTSAGTAIAITGDTTGNLAFQTSAGTYTQTMPNGTGTIVVNGVNSPVVSGTAVASTSGTSIDFTSIPSWVKRITVMFNDVSTNSTSPVLLQVGSGSVTTTGYSGSTFSVFASSGYGVSNYTTGFGLGTDSANGYSRQGSLVLTLQRSNVWICSGIIGQNDTARANMVGGAISLGGALDRVRITTSNGTDTFDAGSINIQYE